MSDVAKPVVSAGKRRDLTNITVKPPEDHYSNPAPTGLCAFGLTTILLNLHNAGFYPLDSMIMGMGVFYGGVAQVIVGAMEFRKNNTFGTTAFTSYGLFWLSLVAIWVLPKLGLAEPSSNTAMGFYLFVWGLFTFGLWIGARRLTLAANAIFLSLTVLFVLLALANWLDSHVLHVIAGIEGIMCGSLAMYTGLAQVLNEIYGRALLPIGAPQPTQGDLPAAPGH